MHAGPVAARQKGEIVVVTISGRARNVGFDHALEIAEYYKDEGWFFENMVLNSGDLTVHAWADLEPYKGDKSK